MIRMRPIRSFPPPRPWATAMPVLLAALALPFVERAVERAGDAGPERYSPSSGGRSGKGLAASRPLEAEATAEEVFEWLRSVERIAFEQPMELRLDIGASDAESPRLRATVVAVPDADPLEEKR